MTDALVDDLQQFVELVPVELSKKIYTTLEASVNWHQIRSELLPLVHSSFLSDLLTRIMDASQSQGRLPGELAFALQAALAVEKRRRETPKLELIWSGPVFSPFSLRRTDETILQLIQQATHRLTLVSFAVYRMERLSQALSVAVERGVTIKMFMELSKTKPMNLRKLYGNFLATNMHFYTWSDRHRLRSDQNGFGVFHAKAVMVDGHGLLVSSANLTEYAMSLNIELGLLVQGGELPNRAEKIFDDYIDRGVFARHLVMGEDK